MRIHRLSLLITLSLCACLDSENFDQGNVRYSFFDFSKDLQDWSAAVSGHSITERQEDLIEMSHSSLPTFFNPSKALKIKVKNEEGKLFMFIKRQIHGLDSNANYKIECEIRLVSELLVETEKNQDVEIFCKYGSSTIEPMVTSNTENGIYELNLDVVNRDESGGEIKYVQKINPPISVQMPVEQVINSFSMPLTGLTDAEGKLWVLIGIELHSKAEMAFYYNTIVIYYTRM
jgi:hypothetical protein